METLGIVLIITLFILATWLLIRFVTHKKQKKDEKEYMELVESMKEDMVREMMKAGRTRLGEIKEQKEQQ